MTEHQTDLRVPPHPAGTVKLLRERGHVVTIRQQRTGSLRYRIDGGRELQAIEMDRFYRRTYERQTFVDVSNVQEYGLTQKLSSSIRCF